MGEFTDIRNYIAGTESEMVDELSKLVSQPSISTYGIGIQETAGMIRALLKTIGAEVEIIDNPNGYPAVYGKIEGRSDKNLLFYNHYDVQPAEKSEGWVTDPFTPELKKGYLYGRGVADNKGDIIARIYAIKAILNIVGTLPVGVKFLIEGEEEIGSPNLPDLVNKMSDKLKADGCIWETGAKIDDERPEITLGCKGIAYIEVTAKSGTTDLHSSLAPVIKNPAWYLVRALNSLKDMNDNILVEGFDDDIKKLTPFEREALTSSRIDEKTLKKTYGIEALTHGDLEKELSNELIISPTCTICGINSGYFGEGIKTVLPSHAMAKLDFRLVPDQDPDDICSKVKKHFRDKGFKDLKVRCFHGEHPYRARLDSDIVNITKDVCEMVYHKKPSIILNSPGTGPMYTLSGRLNIPTVAIGIANAGSAPHGPNENIKVEDLVNGCTAISNILMKMADI